MRLTVLAAIALVASPLAAQEDAVTRLRARLDAAPRLALERTVLDVDPLVTFGMVSAMSSDADGNIYVLHRPEVGDPVVVLDPNGRLLRSWGAGMYTIPHGIRVDSEGAVWTVDSNTSKVYKFSSRGDRILDIQIRRSEREGQFCGAADISFASNGHAFVADGYCNGRVVELDTTGERVDEWGSRGTEPGQFVVVHSVAVAPDGAVYVADRENGRLQAFDQDGELHTVWEYVSQLFSVAFSPSGELFISVRVGGDPEEVYVMQLDRSSGDILGWAEGFGHELAFTPDGSLLVAEGGAEVVLLRPRH